jgi:hypothetical protein
MFYIGNDAYQRATEEIGKFPDEIMRKDILDELRPLGVFNTLVDYFKLSSVLTRPNVAAGATTAASLSALH